MSDAAENRLRERLIMLIVWTGTVAIVTLLGIGFAGGVTGALEAPWYSWLMLVSPVIPLGLWLKARADCRTGL